MYTVIRTDIALCHDCHMYESTGDASFFDYHYGPTEAEERFQATVHGLIALPHLVSETREGEQVESEFSTRQCDCCGSKLAGFRAFYAQLGKVVKP